MTRIDQTFFVHNAILEKSFWRTTVDPRICAHGNELCFAFCDVSAVDVRNREGITFLFESTIELVPKGFIEQINSAYSKIRWRFFRLLNDIDDVTIIIKNCNTECFWMFFFTSQQKTIGLPLPQKILERCFKFHRSYVSEK